MNDIVIPMASTARSKNKLSSKEDDEPRYTIIVLMVVFVFMLMTSFYLVHAAGLEPVIANSVANAINESFHEYLPIIHEYL